MCTNLTEGFSCLHVSINYASTTMALTKYACILLQHVLKPLKFPYRNRSFFSARYRFKKEIFSSIMFRLLTATRSDCVPSIALADDGSGSDNMSASRFGRSSYSYRCRKILRSVFCDLGSICLIAGRLYRR